ncbi:MAG: HAMP domain-containing histidine kinase [Anaerolineae bacterium]|uniref:sensor histidine kinase n=1 Tax=Candidatus Flexifilum breve TaxID=3140694 RepID=UPI001AC5B516|nr:HAMP domain-containing histidine kinase [Chloroflexota bacterium]MBK9749747.1 HAMP domain-containing histidine kinase [Chloroflexota bacterium]MBN8638845.1 HAMP domain-containing histidine kinase [Anaerolineae bacterium]
MTETQHVSSVEDQWALLALAQLAAENAALRAQLDEQKRMTDEVDVLRNAIVRNVSHELKTPLLQIKSAVALLAEEQRGESKLADYAMEATVRLEAVVRNITQLADTLDIQPEPMPIMDAIDQALRNLRRSWEFKGQTERIKVELGDDLPLVLADKQGLGVTLQLLLDNALKFSQKPVRLTVRRKARWVIFTVRDSGIGIAPDKLDKIFDPFYQVDNSSTRRFGGTGVGLAIVRTILERHQTEIQVKSEVGKGSTFTFALRVAELKSQVS